MPSSNQSPNVFVVIPTIRTLDFLEDWKEQFAGVSLIVCEDHAHKEISIPPVGNKQFHYSWEEIDDDLGKSSWIIPRKVSAIRNYGFLQAHRLGADIVITLDDDCFPVSGHQLVELHLYNLSLTVPRRWMNTFPDARYLYTRGMPYLNRRESEVVISHGLWTNVLDLDAPTHLQHLHFRSEFAEHLLQIIPEQAYFPMCSMNLAFSREVIPLLYFPLMGETSTGKSWGFDRFDDIWAGIIAKKILDHLGLAVINGAPFVEHRKASDPFVNLRKEALGISANEQFWLAVDEVKLTKSTPVECYKELAHKVKWPQNDYFKKLVRAMKIWADLF